MSSPTTKAGIVFAHGLWADGSCFSKVIGPLQAEGYDCIASGHGLNSLKSDVENVIRCIGRVGRPVVLVGHSYGGTLITHAGMDDRVAALVYLCALAPDEGESSQAQQDNSIAPPSSISSTSLMVGYGSERRGSNSSVATSRMRTRDWYMPPLCRRRRTFSPCRTQAPPGRRSRVGMSSDPRIARSILNSSASLRIG